MLELVFLLFLTKRIRIEAQEKGLGYIKFQLLLVGLWIASEFLVIFIAENLLGLLIKREEEAIIMLFYAYFVSLMAAFLSAWLLFRYLRSLPSLRPLPLNQESSAQELAPSPQEGTNESCE